MSVSESESESHVTTNGQSASLSWNKVPIWGLRPDFYYCQIVVGLLMWGTVCDERMGPLFTIAAGPCQCSHSWIRVPWDSWPYFTVSDSRLPFSFQEQVELVLMLQLTVSWPVSLGIKHPSGAYDQICITVRQLRVCWCGVLCLTRGWVCCSQLLLAPASTFIPGSKSCGTCKHILLSQIRNFPFCRLL
jgi:hypothetical protein